MEQKRIDEGILGIFKVGVVLGVVLYYTNDVVFEKERKQKWKIN